MPKFQVELDTGQKYIVEADTQPTTEEVVQYINQQKGSLPTQATEEQYISTGERFRGGFMREEDLQARRETQRAERGLAPGTPLEPTGFNLRNVMDLPGDIADAIGPAFPAITASIGGAMAGAATLPTGVGAIAGVAGGGAAGGALGELIRQRVGSAMGFDQGKVIDQLGDILEQGAYGAVQEVGGVALGRALNATKLGLLKAADKLIKTKGMEGFVKGFGSIATHLDGVKTQFALDAVKRGDKRVLSSLLANKDFADNFAKNLFFGEQGNLAGQIYRLAHRNNAKEPIKALYKEFLGISDDVFETVFNKGAAVNSYAQTGTVLNLAKQVNSGLDDLFKNVGNDLKTARSALKNSAGGIDVTDYLSKINNDLANELQGIGFLVKEADGVYSINPKYAGLTTGKEQAKTFGELVSRFFKLEEKKGGTFVVSDPKELLALVGGKARKTPPKFSVNNSMKFKEFADKLGQIDVQISSNEFKKLGELSPTLAKYLKGLREIPVAVESQAQGSQVKTLTQAYTDLFDGASLLKRGVKGKNIVQVESALKRFTNAEPGTALYEQAGELNSFLQKNLKIDLLDELRSFKASQAIKEFNQPFSDLQVRKKMVSLMKDAFSERNISLMNILENQIDPVLPSALKIGEHAKIHTVAEALHMNSASLLRARFLYNILISGALGSMAYGPFGTIGGVGLGLALQNPGILRNLIKASAFMSKQEIKQLLPTGISRTTATIASKIPVGGRVLQELIKKR